MSQQMSPAWQHWVPQHVSPVVHAGPLHGTAVHLPCWQNGVVPVQR
jgi:hypothetical protein